MQGSQSRLRDENVPLPVLTAQVKSKKHMSDCNQIAAEQFQLSAQLSGHRAPLGVQGKLMRRCQQLERAQPPLGLPGLTRSSVSKDLG